MRKRYGEDWLKRVLFDNEAAFVRRPEGAALLTARGEYSIAVAIGFKVVRGILDDTPTAPIRFFIPEEGAPEAGEGGFPGVNLLDPEWEGDIGPRVPQGEDKGGRIHESGVRHGENHVVSLEVGIMSCSRRKIGSAAFL